jgi:transposase IS66 family protein
MSDLDLALLNTPSRFALFTQFPNVPSLIPKSRATSATGRPELITNSTASALYSWVYFRRAAPIPTSLLVDRHTTDRLSTEPVGVQVGLSGTTGHGDRPGERKARLLLEVLHNRKDDVLRFAHDLQVPPTSNQAERDLRPAKLQQNISGRLTSEARTRDRYRIRGYLSTAIKHGTNAIDALRQTMLGQPWTPPQPTPA